MMMSRTTLLVFALVCLAAPPPAAPGASGVVLDDDGRQGGLLGTPLGQLVPDVRVSKTGGTGAGVATVVATIGEALKLSKNRKRGALHFVIHVTADTYDEHLVIGPNDKYIVMIGDGIGRTVITGNLSDRTGDDVKESATMGKPSSILFVTNAPTSTYNHACTYGPAVVVMLLLYDRVVGVQEKNQRKIKLRALDC